MSNYYLIIDGGKRGPYTVERIRGMWAKGQIAKGTHCLKEGEAQPRPIEVISEITSPPHRPAGATAPAAAVSPADVMATGQANWRVILPAWAALLVISLLVIFMGGSKKPEVKKIILADTNQTDLPPPPKKNDPGIDGPTPDDNRTFNPGTGLGSNFQAGPALPLMVQGRDYEYSLGKLEIRTYGTELPVEDQNYLRKKADELIAQFETYTGLKPPKGFYYQVYYYKDAEQFGKVTGRDPNRVGGITYWNYVSRDKIAPIHCHGGFHTLLHEMVHAITWPAYGHMPLFMTEGFAEWLAYMFLFDPAQKNQSELFSKVKVLANRIRANSFPTLDEYLKTQTYEHWQRMFGQIGLGYGAGALLVDFLLVNDPDWTKKALAHCHQSGQDELQRSMAFHKHVQDHWPGGMAGLDKAWRDWILKKEKAIAKNIREKL